ncbi:hypothetical protein ACVRXQ_06075 [Streptococcus panodentis]|uniref:Uncharacterized protein n=1 Tax=Streptococcus panodentis TaxID=1581472 RepID=A0ABS5AX77_9STRE|nr:hypothetical protein [Streptococcus panodentis]MBP2620344.1 hypothetical protein [Streptococcus panodentis]
MDLFEEILNETFVALVVDGNESRSLKLYDNYASTEFSGSVRKTEAGYVLRIQDPFFGESRILRTDDARKIYDELWQLEESLRKVHAAMSDYRLCFD